jgi:D-aspartate ligase
VWMFNGYFDESSECRLRFTGKKIRQSPPYTGATTLGVCEANPAVEQDTVRLMKAVGYRGILDIGFRFDERDGQYKLLDVNPRIGGTFRLFVGPNGMDVLRAMYLDLTGQPVPSTSLPEGRRWIVEPLDVLSSITYRRRGDITLPGWVRSLRGVREAAWFARDDPLPFVLLWLGTVFYWLPQRLLRR